MSNVRMRILQALAVGSIGCGVTAIGIWTYVLLHDGYRLGIVPVLSLCVLITLCFLGSLYLLTKPRVVSILTPKGRTSGVLMGECFQKYAGVSIAIPAIFTGLTISRIDIGSSLTRDNIIYYVDFLWPPFNSQFAEIANTAGMSAATNYLMFFLTLFASFIGLVIYTWKRYNKERDKISGPQLPDVFLLVIFTIGWCYAIFLDYPKLHPKLLFNFYVDTFGLYFFRQWFVFIAAAITPLLLLILVRKTIDKVLKRDNHVAAL